MTSQLERARRFQALHRGPGTFVIPNPSDLGTARLLETASFPALATSTAGLAFTLGTQDGQVGREATIQHIREIASATSLPVSADLGTGFGREPEIVAETIRLAAAAGAVGGSIEDWSGDPADPLIDITLAKERIEAAAEAARNLPFPFLLTARAENFLVGRADLSDTLKRLSAYKEAGADVLYAPALPDAEAVSAVVALAGDLPVNVLALGSGACSDIPMLASLGVRRISLGSALTRVAFTAIDKAIAQLRAGNLDFIGEALSLAELNARFPALRAERP